MVARDLLHVARAHGTLLRLCGGLAMVAFGSGVVMSEWAHVLFTAGVSIDPTLIAFFTRYLNGDLNAVALTVLVGPIVEECVARGLFLRGLLYSYRPTAAVIASALLFGIGHGNIYQLLPGVWMGLVLGLVYAYSGSLVACIVGHMVYNAQFWLIRTVFGADIRGYSPVPLSGLAGAQPIWWLVMGTGALAGGLVVLWYVLRSDAVPGAGSWRRKSPVGVPAAGVSVGASSKQ